MFTPFVINGVCNQTFIGKNRHLPQCLRVAFCTRDPSLSWCSSWIILSKYQDLPMTPVSASELELNLPSFLTSRSTKHRLNPHLAGLEKTLRLLQALAQITAAYSVSGTDAQPWLQARNQIALGDFPFLATCIWGIAMLTFSRAALFPFL